MLQKFYLGICISLILILPVTAAHAQDSYQPGYAILNDGTRLAGQIIPYSKTPWSNQRYIWMKDSAAVADNASAKPKKI